MFDCKTIYQIVVCFFLFSSVFHSQIPEVVGPPGGVAYQIMVHPGNSKVIYATNNYSGLFRKDEEGVHIVNTRASMDDFNSLGLARKDENCIYTSHSSNYLISFDKGLTWNPVYCGKYAYISFNPLNSDIVYIIRYYKELWRSYDKGLTWSKLKVFDKNIRCVETAPSDTSIIYAALEGELQISTNSGRDWNKTTDLNGRSFRMIINPLNPNSLYIHVEGWLYKLENRGTLKKNLGLTDVSTFVLNPKDTLVIYSASGDPLFSPAGGILKSTDEGKSWTPVNNGLDAKSKFGSCLEINPDNPEELYAGIGGYGVYKSINGAGTWELTDIISSYVYHYYVNPENPEVIQAAPYWSKIMHRDQTGKWMHPQIEPDPVFSEMPVAEFDFNPFNTLEGFMCSDQIFYKTTDGGKSYSASGTFKSPRYVTYHTYVKGLVFMGCLDGSTLIHYKSTDGGISWNRTDQAVYGMQLTSFHKTDPDLVYRYNDFELQVSTDMGLSWESKTEGLIKLESGSQALIGDLTVHHNNPDILYCAQSRGLSKSTDRGKTWFRIDSALIKYAKEYLMSAVFLDSTREGRIYVAMGPGGNSYEPNYFNGGLYLTEDNGKTWKKIFDAPVFSITKSPVTNNLYLSTYFGILKLPDTATVTSVRSFEEAVPEGFRLYQNYPNPFNPVTRIKFSLREDCFVSLKIFDSFGQEVSVLVNERKARGTYEAGFDAGNISSGVYYYQIIAEEFVQTGKMLIVK